MKRMVFYTIFFSLCLAIGIFFLENAYFSKKNSIKVKSNRQVIVLNNSALLSVANSLSAEGLLFRKTNGHLRLKVSDDYINKLYPIVKAYVNLDDRTCLSPSSNINHQLSAAHVTLQKNSISTKDWKLLTRKNYPFKVNNFINAIILLIDNGTLIKETWYELSISAPELAAALKLNPDKAKNLHISLAVSRIRVDNGQCY